MSFYHLSPQGECGHVVEAENLRDFVKERVSEEAQRFLEATYDLTTHAQINMADVEDYTATLDELCRMAAKYLVDESGLGESST